MLHNILNRISSAFTAKIISHLDNIVTGLKTINDNFSLLMKFLTTKPDSTPQLICDYESNDEEKIFCGYSVKINDKIVISQPSVRAIVKYGASKYYAMIYGLCSVGADLKWQLDDIGRDYTQIDDFELFYSGLAQGFNKEQTSILFGDDIDFSKMQIMYNKQIDEVVMVQVLSPKEFIMIDRYTYNCIVNTLRKMHRIKRNNEKPGNEATRRILIEDAREEYEENKDKPQRAFLLPLISSLTAVYNGNRDLVLDLNISAFVDGVARVSKIKNAELLLSSGYSGFGVDLKKIDKKEINWIGNLDD